MNNSLQKGFTSLAGLILASLLLSLGGIGSVVGFGHLDQNYLRESFMKILGASGKSGSDTLVLGITGTGTSSGTTGTTGETGSTGSSGIEESSGATGVTESSGATGVTDVTPTLLSISGPTGIVRQGGSEDEDEIEDNEDSDNLITHATGATNTQQFRTGKPEERHDDGKSDE